MLGIFSRSWASRSHGSSLRNRIAVSNVAPPHISIEKIAGTEPGIGVGDAEHVAGPDPGRQQRLVRVAERGVGQQERLLLADPSGERLGAHLLEPLPRARRRVDQVVEPRRVGLRRRRVAGRPRHAGEAVDRDLGGVAEQLGRPILAEREAEQLGGLVEEPGGALAGEESRVRDHVEQERDVRLHAPDAELLERPLLPPRRVDEPPAVGADLDQQRVVERRDDAAGDRRPAVGPDAQAADRAVVGDPAVVGRELVLRVLGRDPALEGDSPGPGSTDWSAMSISGSESGAPSAIRIWLLTRSTPVTISVTVCSTWMRGLTSMK